MRKLRRSDPNYWLDRVDAALYASVSLVPKLVSWTTIIARVLFAESYTEDAIVSLASWRITQRVTELQTSLRLRMVLRRISARMGSMSLDTYIQRSQPQRKSD